MTFEVVSKIGAALPKGLPTVLRILPEPGASATSSTVVSTCPLVFTNDCTSLLVGCFL